MALTPNRRSTDSRGNGSCAPGDGDGRGGSKTVKRNRRGTRPRTLLEQLEAAGMDLAGHGLADRLSEIAAVSPPDFSAPVGDRSAGSETSGLSESESDSRESGETFPPPCVSDMDDPFRAAARERRDTSVPDSPHPLFTKEQWAELKAAVPEVTASIEAIAAVEAEVRDFRRPLGPDDAVLVMEGIEALSRSVDSLQAVTLSVFERVGTPKDYGAKSTKSLVQNRLNLSAAEAHRRTELAKNLGNRVDLTGQSRPPKYPLVASGLRTGRLSASQASAIGKCLDTVPLRLGDEVRERIEVALVDRAPTVRVSDIPRIFADLLDRVDPDGSEPTETHDRAKYAVTVRRRRDGDWDLAGLLDPVTGGIIEGWLTSRVKPDDRRDSTEGTGAGAVGAAERHDGAGDEEMVGLFADVLSGDRGDVRVPAGPLPQGSATGARGWGVREDGSVVDTSAAQGTVKALMYERFATLISRSEMDRVGKGAPFALVVTATAEDLAQRRRRAATGAEAEFPIDLAADEGLNGSVFFHLMSDKAASMALATEQRHATRRQLAVLAARDRGCTFPGCESPPGWCDAHHIVPWAMGGRTDVNNLTLACGMHHHLLDRSDWYAIMLKDGRPAWVPPESIDVERRPVLHARFIARDAGEALFDDEPFAPITRADVGIDPLLVEDVDDASVPTEGEVGSVDDCGRVGEQPRPDRPPGGGDEAAG